MFKGKALLVIDRVEASGNDKFQWDIHPIVLSLNRNDPGGEVDEAFSIMRYNYFPAPSAAYKMNVGDRIRVAVTFEIHYSQDYEGEWDMDLYLNRERVLRRQYYNSKKFKKNFYRLLNR